MSNGLSISSQSMHVAAVIDRLYLCKFTSAALLLPTLAKSEHLRDRQGFGSTEQGRHVIFEPRQLPNRGGRLVSVSRRSWR